MYRHRGVVIPAIMCGIGLVLAALWIALDSPFMAAVCGVLVGVHVMLLLDSMFPHRADVE